MKLEAVKTPTEPPIDGRLLTAIMVVHLLCMSQANWALHEKKESFKNSVKKIFGRDLTKEEWGIVLSATYGAKGE